jgi:hypothetical protein
MTINPALLSSNNQTFNTPAEFLDLVRRLGVIGLDPCSNPHSIVNANIELSLENGQDGLTADWLDRGLVFVNPPYGRALPIWIKKASDSWHQSIQEGRDFECLMLVPSRTDTRWFTTGLLNASALGFWRGRLTFLGAPDPAPFPSLAIYFGHWANLFESVFDRKSHVWKLPCKS